MGGLPRGGVASVAANGGGCRNLHSTVRRFGENSGRDAVFLYQSGCFPTHAKLESGEPRGFGGEEVEEVPLRHQGDELRVRWEMEEIGHRHGLLADESGGPPDLGVTDGEQLVEEAEFVHELEGGGMDSVA